MSVQVCWTTPFEVGELRRDIIATAEDALARHDQGNRAALAEAEAAVQAAGAKVLDLQRQLAAAQQQARRSQRRLQRLQEGADPKLGL